MAGIFISYRREDSADTADRIFEQLSYRFGRENVFRDIDSIPPGVDFKTWIEQGIRSSRMVLVIVGKDWLNAESNGQRRLDDPNDPVRLEIESALTHNVPMIPLLVRGATMPSLEELPASLSLFSNRNAINIRPNPDFHNDM